MYFSTDIDLSSRVLRDARHYVEQGRIPFFDFFRNCAFGFVLVAEKKGYFTSIYRTIEDGEEHIECRCTCREVGFGEICGHGAALFLKIMNFPLRRQDLSQAFDQFELTSFVQTVGLSLVRTNLNRSENPRFQPHTGAVDKRFLEYLGFTTEETKLILRDRQELQKAKNHTRTETEHAMLERNLSSAKVLFEESHLYGLCKYLFLLSRKAELKISVFLLRDHQVRLAIDQGRREVLEWQMPLKLFLKGAAKHWDYWSPRIRFKIQREPVRLAYSIQFTADNGLEIEPHVAISPGNHAPLGPLCVPGDSNLFFHIDLGYFRIQTGLNPFEMTHSNPGIHHVPPGEVKAFLTQFLSILENLDRQLIDQGLFGEVVIEAFDSFHLRLLDFRNERFEFQLTVSINGQSFSEKDLGAAFAKDKRYVKFGGKLLDTRSIDAVYLRPLCFEEQNTEEEDEAVLPVGGLFRFLVFFKDRLKVETTQLTEEIYRQMREFKVPRTPRLSHTRLELRAYQHIGYEWLFFLKKFGLGGLLCDQMGLGKTHQGMALAAALLREKPNAHILVVAPTSVLFHWRQKIETFCPDIAVNLQHGLERHGKVRQGGITITSYGTLRNDVHHWKETVLDLIIFDEIQYLKNKSTKSYQAISGLKSLCRIGLTGTPIENHVGELKGLMDLVLPGYLGSDAIFDYYFANPILKKNDTPAKQKLREITQPFLLRRAKTEVLAELPEKTEDLRSYELTEYERELYTEVRNEGKATLAGQSGGAGALHIFQLIDLLKRLCDHPALYFGNADYTAYPCAKWEMFTELLQETLDSGQKLVVFTQFLGMIDIFEKYLTQQEIGFATITGSTRDREGEQARFQTDPECRVFLGSVRAAGVGIDLTAGSVVIHYDRWWNPAREEQATDRLHRIGQRNHVQVYKFSALNTVEERINEIIEGKRQLLSDVVGFDDESVSKTLTVEELLEILA